MRRLITVYAPTDAAAEAVLRGLAETERLAERMQPEHVAGMVVAEVLMPEAHPAPSAAGLNALLARVIAATV